MVENLGLQFNKKVSLHEQIADDMRHDILLHYQIGDKLPSESEYVKKYQVARTTIQRALKILEGQGVIESVHGKGSFVKLHKPKIDMFNFSGFSDYARKINAIPITKEIQRHVFEQHHHRLMCLRRLRGIKLDKLDETITRLTLDESILDLETYPGLDNMEFERHSLYDTLCNEYGVRPATANLSMDAITPNHEIIDLLELPGKIPVLMARGNVFTYDNQLVEQVRIIYSNQAHFKFIVGI